MNRRFKPSKFERTFGQFLLNASRKNFPRGIVRRPRQVFIILLVSLIPTILFPAPLVQFNDVTATHGINATDPRSLAIGDYDGDGDLDLFFTEDSIASHLFANNGIGVFTDQATAAGLALTGLGGDSDSIFWDFNNDGHLDLYIAQNGDNYHMVSQGNGTFINNALLAGLRATGRTNSAVPIDYDFDGNLDLYLGQGDWGTYAIDLLLRNQGDGTFEDVTSQVGLGTSTSGGGALMADYNNDGDQDLYIIHNGTNLFYSNNGDGTFTELTGIGVDFSGVGNSGVAGDFDNDGDIDIFIVNDEHSSIGGGVPVKLLRNNFIFSGTFNFSDVTALAGITNITDDGTDATFGDVDNDGDLDLYVTVQEGYGTWQNHLYLNRGNGIFDDVTESAGLVDASYPDNGGCSFADLDKDGDLDLVISDRDFALLENVSTGIGHWLSIGLRGTVSNRNGIGARVWVLSLPDGSLPNQVRELQYGKPRGTQNSPWLHFGLGSYDGPLTVRVRWPRSYVGYTENFDIESVDQHIVLLEGEGYSAAKHWHLYE